MIAAELATAPSIGRNGIRTIALSAEFEVAESAGLANILILTLAVAFDEAENAGRTASLTIVEVVTDDPVAANAGLVRRCGEIAATLELEPMHELSSIRRIVAPADAREFAVSGIRSLAVTNAKELDAPDSVILRISCKAIATELALDAVSGIRSLAVTNAKELDAPDSVILWIGRIISATELALNTVNGIRSLAVTPSADIAKPVSAGLAKR